MWNPLESIRRQVEEYIYTQLVVKPISTTSELGRDGCLTSLLSVLSNSTTRPPLSPVAKCSPLLSNSMAEMMSTAAHQSSDMLSFPQLSMFRLPHFICSRACFKHNGGITFCTLEMVHVNWTGTRKGGDSWVPEVEWVASTLSSNCPAWKGSFQESACNTTNLNWSLPQCNLSTSITIVCTFHKPQEAQIYLPNTHNVA